MKNKHRSSLDDNTTTHIFFFYGIRDLYLHNNMMYTCSRRVSSNVLEIITAAEVALDRVQEYTRHVVCPGTSVSGRAVVTHQKIYFSTDRRRPYNVLWRVSHDKRSRFETHAVIINEACPTSNAVYVRLRERRCRRWCRHGKNDIGGAD